MSRSVRDRRRRARKPNVGSRIESRWIVLAILSLAVIVSASEASEKAAEYKSACDAGDADACAIFGAHVIRGIGVEADPGRGIEIIEGACEGGSLSGCYNLGVALLNGPEEFRDPPRARSVLEQGCAQGIVESCSLLGMVYREGHGGPKNLQAAVRTFEAACEAGNGVACLNLGASYRMGEGVEADLERSAHFYRLSCEIGEEMGCKNLARLEAEKTAPPAPSSWKTTIGTTTVNGLVFDEVRATCNMLETMMILAQVREAASGCATGEPSEKISLVIEGGTSRATSAPDGAVGRCVAGTVEAAKLGGSSCTLEFSIRNP